MAGQTETSFLNAKHTFKVKLPCKWPSLLLLLFVACLLTNLPGCGAVDIARKLEENCSLTDINGTPDYNAVVYKIHGIQRQVQRLQQQFTTTRLGSTRRELEENLCERFSVPRWTVDVTRTKQNSKTLLSQDELTLLRMYLRKAVEFAGSFDQMLDEEIEHAGHRRRLRTFEKQLQKLVKNLPEFLCHLRHTARYYGITVTSQWIDGYLHSNSIHSSTHTEYDFQAHITMKCFLEHFLPDLMVLYRHVVNQ